jgi:glyoxylase-like metal-dependent hydrolase (beta-lactamase superfamily II)
MKISSNVAWVAVPLLAMFAAPRAQTPPVGGGGQARGGAGQDVQVAANQLGPGFYALQATGLSTVGALVGPDGVLMVDSGTAAFTDRIVTAIKGVSDRPIRFLVNTHLHPDHTGGNENFAKLGVVLLARDELRTRLAVPGRGGPPAAGALPLLTYRDRVTFHMNGEDVELIPVRGAHTDGDTMIYFPKADALMVGDFYRSIQYPNIDLNNGGSVKGVVDGLNAVIALAKPTTKIVPGHGPVVDKNAVSANRDMILAIRDRVSALVAQGKSQEEVIAAKPLADFDARVQQAGTTGDRFLGQLYTDLKAGK